MENTHSPGGSKNLSHPVDGGLKEKTGAFLPNKELG